MNKFDIDELKKGGILKQKEEDLFSLRLRVVGGYVTAAQLPKLAEISEKYGKGHVHLTTRQGVEIPFVHFDDIEKVRTELAEVGLTLGACGPRLRTITACQGALCSHGLVDTLDLAMKIDEKYGGRGGLPHKFKIGVTGCANACIKPSENDLGIMGMVKKRFVKERCDLCGLCPEVCPVEDTLWIEGNSIQYDAAKCVHCGQCINVCPVNAWEAEYHGYTVFAGGKMGKYPKLGKRIAESVRGEDRLFEIIDITLDFYEQKGKRGERFRDTLDRLGFDLLRQAITVKV